MSSYDQAEQTKYEARIVGLQRAKQEAVAKAEAQSQKATQLQQELDRLTTEKARSAKFRFPLLGVQHSISQVSRHHAYERPESCNVKNPQVQPNRVRDG